MIITHKYPLYWGELTHLLTIDLNFLGHASMIGSSSSYVMILITDAPIVYFGICICFMYYQNQPNIGKYRIHVDPYSRDPYNGLL